jgi:hypothetical protein
MFPWELSVAEIGLPSAWVKDVIDGSFAGLLRSRIEVAPESPFLRICGGFLMKVEDGSLGRFLDGGRDAVIGKEIAAMGDPCFAYCRTLGIVAFEAGGSVSILANNLFRESSVESICIPAGVKSIGDHCLTGARYRESHLRLAR